ncbi:hypothetical protein KM043_007862 [Ampulex compressa]|nr:hypothetical protein KM043_007862 [Ampulex compressa]
MPLPEFSKVLLDPSRSYEDSSRVFKDRSLRGSSELRSSHIFPRRKQNPGLDDRVQESALGHRPVSASGRQTVPWTPSGLLSAKFADRLPAETAEPSNYPASIDREYLAFGGANSARRNAGLALLFGDRRRL